MKKVKNYQKIYLENPQRGVLEEIGNAITHGIGALLSILGLVLLLLKCEKTIEYISSIIYCSGLIILFTMSCLYHSFKNQTTVKNIFRRFDHLSIYILIVSTFIPIILGLIIIMLFGVLKDRTDAHDITSCITSLIYGGLLFCCAFSVEYLKPLQEVSNIKFVGKLFAYMYSIVVCTDIFAYCFGMLFGKHKLCPKISPKKSVEGAVAGLVLGALVGTIVGTLLDVFPLTSLENLTQKVLMISGVYVISLIISAMGQLGDLVASKLKRSYEIKDYGFIFPGHGGVMDRFDSVIFAGSIFFILMQIIYLFL